MLTSCISCRLLRHQRLTLYRVASRYSSDNGLHKVLNDAERFVGYPTRYNSLKMLFEEEPSNIFSFAKKLVGSGHPILATVRDLLSETAHSSHYLGGIWVLLLSKAAGNNNKELIDSEFVEGIHMNQRILAETTDFIYTAYLFHRSMLDPTNDVYLEEVNKKTIELGNNLCVLGGDLLLAKASLALAKLNNTKIVELMGICIGHLAEGSLLESLKNKRESFQSIEEWENHSYLLQGSLIAHSCKAAVIVTGHDTHIQEKAFEFGRNLDLLQKCQRDLECFQNKKYPLKSTNILLISALNSSEKLAEIYTNALSNHETNISKSKELRHAIKLHVPNLTEQYQSLSKKYLTECRNSIEVFQDNTTVVNMINNLLQKIYDG